MTGGATEGADLRRGRRDRQQRGVTRAIRQLSRGHGSSEPAKDCVADQSDQGP